MRRKSRKKDGLQKNIPSIPRKILDLRHKDQEESDAVSSASAKSPKMRQQRTSVACRWMGEAERNTASKAQPFFHG
ncbi:MAG TPA: hypothetical protein OIM07_10535 [Clostridiales bacterium]|nr:hypothetical protein [Clostridiales bacterium]